MRALVMGVVLVLNLILQSTLLQNFAILSMLPNTTLLIIVSYAILRGDVEGAIVGFCAGLLQDLFFAEYIGFYAMCGALTGFLCGKPYKDFFRENYLLPVSLVVVAMFANEIAFYIFHFLLFGHTNFWYYFQRLMLPATVYTLFLSIPIYQLIYRLNEILERGRRRRKYFF